ncbi:MAG: hypothetical protein IPN08_09545 [Bacteroidales bacterium]|nr:hypothetical protein [Bacteroidales bacterium]
MKAKIDEVINYFKTKILSKEFEISKISQHTMEITIDGIYNFTIWIGNITYPETVKLYESNFNFIHINLTATQSKKLFRLIRKDVEDYRNNVTIPQKMAEFNRLKKELNIN